MQKEGDSAHRGKLERGEGGSPVARQTMLSESAVQAMASKPPVTPGFAVTPGFPAVTPLCPLLVQAASLPTFLQKNQGS